MLITLMLAGRVKKNLSSAGGAHMREKAIFPEESVLRLTTTCWCLREELSLEHCICIVSAKVKA